MSLVQNIRKAIAPQKHRLPQVQRAMELLITQEQNNDLDRDRGLEWEVEHLRQSVHYAKMLASQRHIDPDFAACAVAVQNIGRITTGKSEGHADTGYEPARRLLTALGHFSSAEVDQLSAAVLNHSRKENTDSPLDELAKDVDVYVRYLQGDEFTTVHEHRRLARINSDLRNRRT